jgi:hypothetical protein
MTKGHDEEKSPRSPGPSVCCVFGEQTPSKRSATGQMRRFQTLVPVTKRDNISSIVAIAEAQAGAHVDPRRAFSPSRSTIRERLDSRDPASDGGCDIHQAILPAVCSTDTELLPKSFAVNPNCRDSLMCHN